MMRMHRRLSIIHIPLAVFIIILTSCSTLDLSEPEETQMPEIPPNTCLVTPDIRLGGINSLVYGVNHGPWAVITDKTLPLAQEARITMIRYPGGNWGDENDLQPYQIDQFALLAEQLGSEVSLNVRLHNGTPEQAADLVRYTNIENDYNIRYWGIGNEPTLFATSRDEPEYGVERFNEEWRAFAEAMKAVDDSILLIGPELHQFGSTLESTPKDPFDLDWMTEFLKANGDLVDIVSIHRYPFPQGGGGRAATVDELTAASKEWDEIIPYLRRLIIETTGEDLPIAVTEVNSHWSNAIGGEATPDSFINAIWWADALGRMINNDVDVVNYFSLQSNNSTGGYGLFGRSEPRPTYYVYKIFQDFGDERVFAACDDSDLGIYSALDDEDGLSIIIVNLGEEMVSKSLVTENENLNLVSAERFDETNLLHPLELNLFEDLENLEIPPYSITLLKFE